jgi:UDP-glucuronate 4-epimerase
MCENKYFYSQFSVGRASFKQKMTSSPCVLVTGVAGFIGFHLSSRLLKSGVNVVGIDNLNNYYEVKLKEDRLAILKKYESFQFKLVDLKDKPTMDKLFEDYSFETVVNLAAQAGVRHSITHPYTYLESNLTGFLNVLEACRRNPPGHLIYASSSSVYGGNGKMPFSTQDNVDHPLALYAASKKANELMAHAYSNLYKLPTTGLRFFSAYGTYGRPDMALFIFTKAILKGEPIDVYNFGKMKRNFTYIDDIVEGICKLIPHVPTGDKKWNAMAPDPSSSPAPYRIFNIASKKSVELLRFIELIEERLNRKSIKNFLPMQEGDVEESEADIQDLERETGYQPVTSVETGVEKFVAWYLEYYKIKR